MQKNTRIALWVAISLLSFVASSCTDTSRNGNQSNSNQQAVAPQKTGKWVAKFRSPESADVSGTNLATYSYASISVVSPSVVFVAGDMPDSKNSAKRVGVIVHTTDGGANWKETVIRQPGLEIPTINSVHFADQNTGWAVGADSKGTGVMLKTVDGGVTWSAQKLSFKQTPTCVLFTDSSTGWMGGSTPLPGDEESDGGPSDLLTTTDGGATWRSARRIPVSIRDIFFLNKSTGWAAGHMGTIYHTTDRGITWAQQRSELEGSGRVGGPTAEQRQGFAITSIQFVDAQNGWASAAAEDEDAGRVLATGNGGATWTRRWVVQNSGINDVFFVSPTVGWVATSLGKFVYYTPDGAGSWLSEAIVFEQELPIYKIAGADASHIWAVGGGAIYARVAE